MARSPVTNTRCNYCMSRTAHRMVMLQGGTSNGAPSKRWMCESCIQKREAAGRKMRIFTPATKISEGC